MTEWRYWSLPPQASLAPADPPKVFFETLADAVRLRTRSDVPVGVSLSGGLDSTAIICHMATLRAQGDAASRNGALQGRAPSCRRRPHPALGPARSRPVVSGRAGSFPERADRVRCLDARGEERRQSDAERRRCRRDTGRLLQLFSRALASSVPDPPDPGPE